MADLAARIEELARDGDMDSPQPMLAPLEGAVSVLREALKGLVDEV